MAHRRTVTIDGQITEAPASARLADVVSPDVMSVQTLDGEIIARSDFARWPVPAGFERHLSPIEKG
jgi:hypothetical protein